MKKFIFILCAAFLTFALVLGFITYNKTTQVLLSVNIEALAKNENEETSNNEGDGSIYHYEHLLGQPQSCVMYRNVGVNGEVSYSNEKLSGSLGWTSVKVTGIIETCPRKGSGCTVYSCQMTYKFISSLLHRLSGREVKKYDYEIF